jgi:hypothetical protein
MATTSCAACGTPFGCGADIGGCWCNGVETDEATLAQLAGAFSGCLCPDCLREKAVQGAGEPATGQSAASTA